MGDSSKNGERLDQSDFKQKTHGRSRCIPSVLLNYLKKVISTGLVLGNTVINFLTPGRNAAFDINSLNARFFENC
jgi:hypothetical protein